MIDDARARRATEVFLAALEREPADRSELVRELCGEDSELLRFVERMLEEEARKDPAATTNEASTIPIPVDESRAPRIGPYRILSRIGEGGMGTVYLVEQTDPIRRKVAVKVLKPGMDSRAVLARFEAERQALALMEHTNIAKVLDAGETDEGRPYVAMEWVHGVPITDYCDDKGLTNRERLKLFQEVCNAVQHAHQRGVIHRDLKPSNILVTEQDGRALPKIIDFGIAKAISSPLTDKTVHTRVGQFLGTPEYMSPEQAQLGAVVDVDTRTDVYALGVILYELLTGVLPFPSKTLRRAGYEEMFRVIREEEPPRPSTRMTTLGERGADFARRRKTDVRHLARELRGELDWITMKALEKDRTARYGTPSELAQDITRHLRLEAVLARPPSMSYRVRKLYRRHRTAVVSAAVVLLALVLGLAGTTVGFIRAKRAERAAVQEAAVSEQVVDFLVSVFDVSNPFSEHFENEDLSDDVTARDLLERAAARIEQDLAEQQPVQARLMEVMGEVYTELGALDRASSLLESAVESRAEAAGGGDLATAGALATLAHLRLHQEAYAEAESLASIAVGALANRPGADPGVLDDAEETIFESIVGRKEFERAAEMLRNGLAEAEGTQDSMAYVFAQGDLLQRQAQLNEAAEKYELAYELARSYLDPDDPGVAALEKRLGYIYTLRGSYAEAEPLLRHALEVADGMAGRRGERAIADAYNRVGMLMTMQGRHAEAAADYVRAVEIYDARGETASLPAVLNNLSITWRKLGRAAEAEATARRGVEIMRETGSTNPVFVKNLAAACSMTGKSQEASVLFAEALRLNDELSNPENFGTVWLLVDYAEHCEQIGDHETAVRLAERGVEVGEKVHGPEHPDVARCLFVLGRAQAARGRRGEAEVAMVRALEIRDKSLDPDHPDLVKNLEALAGLYRGMGRAAEADELEARLSAGRSGP